MAFTKGLKNKSKCTFTKNVQRGFGNIHFSSYQRRYSAFKNVIHIIPWLTTGPVIFAGQKFTPIFKKKKFTSNAWKNLLLVFVFGIKRIRCSAEENFIKIAFPSIAFYFIFFFCIFLLMLFEYFLGPRGPLRLPLIPVVVSFPQQFFSFSLFRL